MGDTNVQECNCCQIETDCINGLCEMCSDYNYKLQKQSDLLTLGLLQEKQAVVKLQTENKMLKDALNHVDNWAKNHGWVQKGSEEVSK